MVCGLRPVGPKVLRFGSDGDSDQDATMCDDAGSCIDGRLTSAWNWCQHIAEEPFYPVFKLCGFSSFDGEFSQ